MFQITEEYAKIKQELEAIDALQENAVFECFGDSMATFGLKHRGAYYEFCIICEDDYSRSMMVADLLTLKRVTFFNYKVYLKEDQFEFKPNIGILWSLNDINSLN